MDELREPAPPDPVKIDPDERAESGPPEIEAPPAVPGTGVFRCVVDVATGEQKTVELTEAEVLDAEALRERTVAKRAELVAAAAAEVEAKAIAREPDVARVRERAKTDPDFAALARLAGVDVPETQKETPP